MLSGKSQSKELSIREIRQIRQKVDRKLKGGGLQAPEDKVRERKGNGQAQSSSEIKDILMMKHFDDISSNGQAQSSSEIKDILMKHFDDISSKPITKDDGYFCRKVGQYVLVRLPHYDKLYPFDLPRGDICLTRRPMKSVKIVYQQRRFEEVEPPEIEQTEAQHLEDVEALQVKHAEKYSEYLSAENVEGPDIEVHDPAKLENSNEPQFHNQQTKLQPKIEIHVEQPEFEFTENDTQASDQDQVESPQIQQTKLPIGRRRFKFMSNLQRLTEKKTSD